MRTMVQGQRRGALRLWLDVSIALLPQHPDKQG